MRLKTTNDLVKIWQNNDHTEWTDEAFDVVRDLLVELGVTLPKQNEKITKAARRCYELLQEMSDGCDKLG